MMTAALNEIVDEQNIGRVNYNKGIYRGLSDLPIAIEEVRNLIQQKDK
jgi:hypothetical protein